MSDAPSAEVLAHRKSFVAGLRSGRFQQGTGSLHIWDEDVPGNWKHCCLGVACLIAAEDGMEQLFQNDSKTGEWLYLNDYSDADGELIFDNDTILPMKVAKWYGWDDPDPDIPIKVHDRHGNPVEYEFPAAEVNDSMGKNFAEIADAFDAKYVLPFEAAQ